MPPSCISFFKGFFMNSFSTVCANQFSHLFGCPLAACQSLSWSHGHLHLNWSSVNKEEGKWTWVPTSGTLFHLLLIYYKRFPCHLNTLLFCILFHCINFAQLTIAFLISIGCLNRYF